MFPNLLLHYINCGCIKQIICGEQKCYTINWSRVYCEHLQHIHIVTVCVQHTYSVYKEEPHQFLHTCNNSKYCLVSVLYNNN